MAKKKTVKLNKDAVNDLSNNKPAVYKIFNNEGENIYTGSAKRGRVTERIKEHLPGGSDPIPGAAKVKIEQHSSIDEAQKSESRIISRTKPKHNKQGK